MRFTAEGEKALKGLFRGAFALKDIKKGEIFYPRDTFCAIPAVEGQIIAQQLSKYVSFIATEDIKTNKPISMNNAELIDKRSKVADIVFNVKNVLERENVPVPQGVSCAAYAHYGLDKFNEVGAVLINLMNREYSKTLLIMFPGQQYPLHSHKHKEETFYIQSGELDIEVDGEKYNLLKGDLLTIHREQKHSFNTETGVILEEIATTYISGDSYYEDCNILDSDKRKTTFGLY